MITSVIFAIYILGVCVAYVKLLEWNRKIMIYPEDYQNLLLVSLFSWVALILYVVVKMLNDSEDS